MVCHGNDAADSPELFRQHLLVDHVVFDHEDVPGLVRDGQRGVSFSGSGERRYISIWETAKFSRIQSPLLSDIKS